jgi:preprotein translocase subunit SecB
MAKRYSISDYKRDLKKIRLDQVFFIEFNSKLNIDELSASDSITMDSKNSVQVLDNSDNNSFAIIDKYEFTGTSKKKQVLEISMKIMAVFEYDKELGSSFIKLFEKNTLKLITYPYVRQAVQDITQKMGLPPLVLPIWTSVVKT